jgi:hypothetical protein
MAEPRSLSAQEGLVDSEPRQRDAFSRRRAVGVGIITVGIDIAVPIGFISIAAATLVAVPRPIAWVTLAVLPPIFGRLVGRTSGLTASVMSGLAYLFAHGRPRFESTITDRLTIRAGLLLCLLSTLLVLVVRPRERQRISEHEMEVDRCETVLPADPPDQERREAVPVF